jgi:hypothetical protein
MKNLKYLTFTLAAFFVSINFLFADAKDTDESLIDDIKLSASSFEKAIEQRNFKLAKEHLDVLFPLMKKELKLAKKQMHDAEKQGESAKASKLGESLERKIEIHDQLHVIVEASSAALRVKADDAQALVTEYIDLLAEKEQLLSSNN